MVKNDEETEDREEKKATLIEDDQGEKEEDIEPTIDMRNIKKNKKRKKIPKKKRSVNFKPLLRSNKRNMSKNSVRKQTNTLETIVEDSLNELETKNINKGKEETTKDKSNALDTEAEVSPNNSVAAVDNKEKGSSTKEKSQDSESVNTGDQHESNKHEVSNT